MKKINMVDLKSQYLNIKEEIDTAIHETIDSMAFINGKQVKEFQAELEKYLNVKHVIPCANGTDALQVALMALDLEPGDEIISPNFTFIATVEVIALLGLKPVLVDVDPNTFTIDINCLEKAITKKTKAIVPVHLYGQCADMESIMNIAKKHNLFVIEDTAQASGTKYTFDNGVTKHAGTIGHIGCTSFFPSKNLACFGDGGAIFTNDDNLAEKQRAIVNHGTKIKYIHESIGINSRLDSIQAAILRVKLRYLNLYNKSRQKAADFYNNAFKAYEKITVPATNPKSTHIYHQYTLKLNNIDRTKFQEYLKFKGIPSMVYYPIPMHLQKAFYDDKYKQGSFPVSENLCSIVLSLPMHTELDNEQLEYITNTIINYIKK